MDSDSIRTVFSDGEFDLLKERVRSELLPRLSQVRQDVEGSYRRDDPPEEHMADLMESLDTLERHFGDDADAARVIERERQSANGWISEHTPEERKQKQRGLGKVESSERPRGPRSIFDDLDDTGSGELDGDPV